MSYNEEKSISYKQDLKDRKKSIHNQIKAIERVIYKTGAIMDDEWFKNHRKLCFLNIDYETVKSRISNLNNFKSGIAVVELDNNNHK